MWWPVETLTLDALKKSILINGDNNVAANGNALVVHYHEAAKKSEEDWGIVSEIYDYIISSNQDDLSEEVVEANDDFTNLQEKIKINFSPEKAARVEELIKNVWFQRATVEKFLQEKYESSPIEVLSLKELIQTRFCEAKKAESSASPVEDLAVIEALAQGLLPENRRTNCLYLANAKAVVIHFFEFCDIGKKTLKEKKRIRRC